MDQCGFYMLNRPFRKSLWIDVDASSVNYVIVLSIRCVCFYDCIVKLCKPTMVLQCVFMWT